jgi:holo-[acyl-carrier protein] synthase
MRVLGIGTEIVECLRIAQLIERHGEQFIQSVFTGEEIQYCASRKFATQYYAAYWASKRSVLKALGTGWTRDVSWRDMVIRVEPGLGPQVTLTGEVAELAARRGVTPILLSLAHCRTHATAYAMALDNDPGG